MMNLPVFPVILPLLIGAVLLLLHGRLKVQRVLSLLGSVAALGVALLLIVTVSRDGIQVVQGGGWIAPYGITIVSDLFSALMVLLAAVIQLTSLLFAFRDIDEDSQRTFFYPVLQFLMVGINLSFLTGDLFNLFVAFEVMLISSYFLLTLGGSAGQLREGFKYLVINATVSALFLVAIAMLYGVTGTLNMADAAQKVASMPGRPIMTMIAIAFMVVFGTKGALFPLYFWLPKSYYQAPNAITALFAALLTKVGVYALVRVFTLIFVHDTSYTHSILLFVAGGGMILGVLGAVSQSEIKLILAFHSISQIGYMVMGLGLFTHLSMAGSVLYIVHHSIVKSGLFLLSGVTEQVTGTTDLNKFHGALKTHPGLGFAFLATGISLAGVPPFSGFFSKLALVKAGVEAEAWTIVAVSLVVGLFTLVSMIKIFRKGFWGEATGERRFHPRGHYAGLMFPALILLALSTAMGLGAGPTIDFALATADQLMNPEIYIRAVMGR